MADKGQQRERIRLEKLAAKEGMKCYNSFYYFFKKFWSEMSGEIYHDNWHIEYICDVLQNRAMKLINHEKIMETIIINVPPGSSKSTIATIAFPLWVWLHRPNFATTNISYSSDLSKEHAAKARGVTDSDKWHILFYNIFKVIHGKSMEITRQNERRMENNFGGVRFNTSVGGTITGMHANILIEDDPLNPKEAFSDSERQTALTFHDDTVSSRKKNFMSYLNILIAQRLHEEDTCGHVLNQNRKITHLCFPSELTVNTKVIPAECEAYYIDGVLDIKRKPKSVLEDMKSSMTSVGYSGQFLQMPFNLEEQDIKPSMFEIIEAVPEDLIFDVWVDGAYTEKTENDPSGIDLIARHGNNVIVKHAYDVRKKLPDLLAFIVELETLGMFDKDKSRIFIEPKASGHSLADYIEHDTDYNFVRIGEHSKQEHKLVQGGHKARHEMIKPKAESHRINLLKGNWNNDYIMQICGFPRAAHDEHVDNLGYAINHYYMNENSFINSHVFARLDKEVPGSINLKLISLIKGFKIATTYEYNEKGDIQLFEYPNLMYTYRYICVLVLKDGGDRGGETSIVMLDRANLTVSAFYTSNTISTNKAAKKGLEMSAMYGTAKLVIAVKKETSLAQSEGSDLSHIAIKEIRKVGYSNLYSRLKVNDIRKKREREYGFEASKSGIREVYYHLKDQLETAKVDEIPLEILDEAKNLERKKDTGEIKAKEGYQSNSVLAYAIALKVHEETHDKITVKKQKGGW